MRVKVLKSFPYSPDGINIRDVAEKEEFDCREDILDGLVQEGFVSIIAPKKSASASNQLRADGPTLLQYVAAGYPAAKYPPQGYAAKQSSAEEKAKVDELVQARALADAAEQEASAAAGTADKAKTPEEKQAAESAWAALEEVAKERRAKATELAGAAKA